MNRLTTSAIGLAVIAALAAPVFAQSTPPAAPEAPAATEAAPPAEGPRSWFGRKHAEHRQHWGERRDERRDRRGGSHDGPHGGPMGMMGMMLATTFDADGDGVVTKPELSEGLAALAKKYDANGDGALSLDEFAGLHAEVTRPLTVRAFQWVDADGDGQISADEQAKAETMLSRRLPAEAPPPAPAE